MNTGDFQQKIDLAVERLVEEVTEIARRAALQAMQLWFAPHEVASKPSMSKPSVSAPVLRRPRGRGRPKRTGEELEALSQRLVAFVMNNPGLRIEQINRKLGTTTKDLALPIRKLTAEGVIRTRGQKRATTYFAADARS
jgi:hypothetical protein